MLAAKLRDSAFPLIAFFVRNCNQIVALRQALIQYVSVPIFINRDCSFGLLRNRALDDNSKFLRAEILM